MLDGVLIFDEYGISEWTVSAVVDKFVREGAKPQRTNYEAPSASIIKE